MTMKSPFMGDVITCLFLTHLSCPEIPILLFWPKTSCFWAAFPASYFLSVPHFYYLSLFVNIEEAKCFMCRLTSIELQKFSNFILFKFLVCFSLNLHGLLGQGKFNFVDLAWFMILTQNDNDAVLASDHSLDISRAVAL